MTLLLKTRTLNRLLQKTAGNPVSFMEMAEVLSEIVGANFYVLSRKGKILGHAVKSLPESKETQLMIMEERRVPTEMNAILLKIEETSSNLEPEGLYSSYIEHIGMVFEHPIITVVPVIGGGERLGTLVLTRLDRPFIDDDLILAEYGATIVGMEILRERAEESEIIARSKAIVQVAVESLSFSELEAVEHIFDELKGQEGLLVASKIADRAGITRSVIVNALRKLESAGVIETRSLGMKGTYIKILNDQLFKGLEKTR